MRDQPIRCALGFDLLACFAESERLALSENVGKQHVVLAAQWCERIAKRDEVTRNKPRSLMNQLIERGLPVSSGFTPIDWARVIIHRPPDQGDVLAVALHG